MFERLMLFQYSYKRTFRSLMDKKIIIYDAKNLNNGFTVFYVVILHILKIRSSNNSSNQ